MTTLTRPSGANRQYWLLKTEPGEFSLDDLWKQKGRVTHWDGVRNFQARNYLRDAMKKGDLVFFYHSNCAEPGIVGIAEVVKEGYPDHSAFNRKDRHYDPQSDEKNPAWYMIDIRGVEKFPRTVTLAELRKNPELEAMPLVQKGNRLSVQKVGAMEWNAVLKAAKEAPGD